MGAQSTKLQTRGQMVADNNPLPVILAPAPSGVTPASAAWTEATKTVADIATPELLAASGTARVLFLFPLRTNTAEVFWGTAAGNDTQHGTLPAVIEGPDGKLINLASIYLDAAVAGEGVRYLALN